MPGPRTSRPATPDPIKRVLRQEAGFGCCACGVPILQYHHIIPYGVEPHFRPEDMMALCPLHHDQATKGALLEVEQRRLKASPFNMRRGFAEGPLKVNQATLRVQAGGCLFSNTPTLITVNGADLVEMQLGPEGTLQLSLRLFDSLNRLKAEILDNEWRSGDPSLWDIEADHQLLTIRPKRGDVAFHLDARQDPVFLSGRLYRDGHEIRFSKEALFVNGGEDAMFQGCGFASAMRGIDIQRPPPLRGEFRQRARSSLPRPPSSRRRSA